MQLMMGSVTVWMCLEGCCYAAWKNIETRAEIVEDHVAENWNSTKYASLRSDINKQGHTRFNVNSGMLSAPILPM